MLNNGPTATVQVARDTMFQQHEELLRPHRARSHISVPPTARNIAKSEIVCMFLTLQNLEHTSRTAYGDSEETYGGNLWVIPM
jgi:hypothetical protein